MVTGLGVVSAAGWGVDALRTALRSGRTAIGPFDVFDHTRQRTHVAGEVPPPTHPPDVPGWSRLARSDRFAIAAAVEALERRNLSYAATDAADDAGKAASPHSLSSRVGVYFGSSTGGLLETEQYYDALVDPQGTPRRAWLASHHLSAPAESVARALGISGPVETISSACASATLAIAQALDAVASGEVDIALTGGADCLATTTYTGFNALRSVDEAPCRPFREGRAGLSLGEGAAVLVLEREQDVLARGGTPLAVLLGGGSTCDAAHMTAPHAAGEWAAAAIEAALVDAGLTTTDIDYVNAHGTGTPLNDAAEQAALARVFGDRSSAIPIEATKAIVGHLLGAAGAVEAAAVVLALAEGVLHPVPVADGDRTLAVDLVERAPRPASHLRTALSVSLGFGGANAAIVLGRWSA
ncbi:MAG: beta-ketoacyl-[acyl-carrier-protein] synthase family protein [Acidobacteria bacterium]|nr:beta-ketoacyl-[acyl-carrier-protein] synthase family protein [Acidobacteriota bacterium]